MKVAVVGCCHGSLDEIYRLIAEIEAEQKITISLLLICGDFQALRNPADLESIAVPHKYREMGTFHRYYSGKTQAPVLTIFIGGNHEASNYMQELPFGGWVAPGIYYLGLAGVVKFGGLRIAGMSGIFKSSDFGRGHFETLPFGESEKRSIYHVRSLELFRLKLLSNVDIFMTHDWPRGIWQYGNVQELLRWKPYFRQDIENGFLGSPPAEELLYHLKPRYYFAGHLHCRFAAKVRHNDNSNSAAADSGPQRETNFLALDKVLPRRRFLEIVDIPAPYDAVQSDGTPPSLELDPEWLCILKNTSILWSYGSGFTQLPSTQDTVDSFRPTQQKIADLTDDFGGEFNVPLNFEPTAPVYEETQAGYQAKHFGGHGVGIQHYLNPQTALICQMLDIENPNVEWGRRATRRGVTVIGNLAGNESGVASSAGDQSGANSSAPVAGSDSVKRNTANASSNTNERQKNPDEILITEDEDSIEATNPSAVSPSCHVDNTSNNNNSSSNGAAAFFVNKKAENPDEIHLSFESDDGGEESDKKNGQKNDLPVPTSDEPSPKKSKAEIAQ